MSDIPIFGTFAPNTGSTAPLARAEAIAGAWMTVANGSARDAIPAGVRRSKMVVTLSDTGVSYELGAGLTNADWSVKSFGGGGSGTVVDFKDSVRVATTANITLSGTQTIDGIAVLNTDRVLVKNQATGSQNGIYTVAAGAWARSTDADANTEVTSGLAVVVEEGSTNAGKLFILTTANPITLGTTALAFTALSGGGGTTAGNGLTGTGTLSVLPDGSTLGVSASGVKVAAGGISATELATDAVTTAKILAANVTAAKLAAGAVDLATTVVTGTLPVTKGGTGLSTGGSAGQVLTMVAGAPAWAAPAGSGTGGDIAAVDVCSVGNVALTGTPGALDTAYTLVNGVSRVLVAFQTAPAENGVYIANTSGAWTRATDFDSAAEFRPGVWFAIKSGNRYGGGFACVHTAPATLGTNAAVFAIAEPDPKDDSVISHPSTDTTGSRDIVRKASGTEATPSAHLVSANLGERVWQGHDGTAYYDAMILRAIAESAGGTNKSVRFESLLHNGSSLIKGESAVSAPPFVTTNATQGVVYSIPIGADEFVSISFRIVGKQSGSSNRAFRETVLIVRRSGSGNVIELSRSDSLALFTDVLTWSNNQDPTKTGYVLNNSSKAVDFVVQGLASTSITWNLDVVWSVR